MSTIMSTTARTAFATGLRLLLSLGLGCGLIVNVAAAWDGATIVRVEEEWELVVTQPDFDNDAPQVTCVISPVDDPTSSYAALEINYRSQPEFSGGGLQLQVWNNEQLLVYQNSSNQNRLHHAGEVIRWTQTMELDDHVLTFAVTAGSSTTWGTFGTEGELQVQVSTLLHSLNAYSPQVSVSNSGVGFAGNLVGSLVLKRVRLYSEDGLVAEQTTPTTVHPHD